jgi:hypothetical protein
MRDHAMDEHESLKLFTADLKGMKAGQEGYEDKVHQLMEVRVRGAPALQGARLPRNAPCTTHERNSRTPQRRPLALCLHTDLPGAHLRGGAQDAARAAVRCPLHALLVLHDSCS